ncbi:glycine--tRNA ligase subunit beta [Pelagibacteraceae bacterium]|jgi:glycyl-tRNA synthetase beta chain|nr:glycine--tRNA ligase subunit beta [Pelagibacteraceae bacterium]
MAEFLLELYSEEIPHGLQISAREEIKNNLLESLEEESIKYKSAEVYSTPTRLTLLVRDLPTEIKIEAKEVRGPKVDVSENIIEGFMRSHQITKKDLFEKTEQKGNFYCFKKPVKKTQTEDLLVKLTPKAIGSVNWKKSMRWSDHELMWGRPLRSILAIFNNKQLKFDYHHLTSTDGVIIVDNFIDKIKKIKNFKEYESQLKVNQILLKQEDRKNNIIKKFQSICKSKNYLENFNKKLMEEVVNITENPSVILANFDKEYLNIPQEIIISTLQRHQRYFPLFDSKNRLTNNFFIVANKPDPQNIIREGNKRVVLARLSDAKFFWDKDKAKNLIKQISKLKEITFYEKIGTIYDKTQRLRKLAGIISDQLNINKEKIEIAASITKSDLKSDLVGEYPELQGVMGKYFALAQGFEEDVANAVSDHYLPTGLSSPVPKKPLSYAISIIDKLDSLVGFFLINEKPTSSKDPFALRRAAIGLLRIVIENNLELKLKDLTSYALRLYVDQGVKTENKHVEKDILDFLKERMKNILKEKKIKPDIVEAAISSHIGDNYLVLYKKSMVMNKNFNKDMGKNAIYSFKRASSILDHESKKLTKELTGRPDAVLFRKDEEKFLFEKLNEIRKSFTVKEDSKDYEKLLAKLAETKDLTDNFFDNVVVNDENQDIKNNRLELLLMFCKTFNNYIDFSKLDGI